MVWYVDFKYPPSLSPSHFTHLISFFPFLSSLFRKHHSLPKPQPTNQPTNKPQTGIPKIMASSRTLATEVVKNEEREIVFKLRQEYTPKVLGVAKVVDSLVSLSLSGESPQRVVYHKDM